MNAFNDTSGNVQCEPLCASHVSNGRKRKKNFRFSGGFHPSVIVSKCDNNSLKGKQWKFKSSGTQTLTFGLVDGTTWSKVFEKWFFRPSSQICDKMWPNNLRRLLCVWTSERRAWGAKFILKTLKTKFQIEEKKSFMKLWAWIPCLETIPNTLKLLFTFNFRWRSWTESYTNANFPQLWILYLYTFQLWFWINYFKLQCSSESQNIRWKLHKFYWESWLFCSHVDLIFIKDTQLFICTFISEQIIQLA